MRILHVVSNLGIGGAEAVSTDIVTGLSDAHDFAVFSVGNRVLDRVGDSVMEALTGAGVPVFTGSGLAPKYGGVVAAATQLARVVRDFAPDVVHVHTEIPEATLSVARRLDERVRHPVIARTVHNSILWPKWRRVGQWTEHALTPSWVVAVSNGAAEGLTQWRSSIGLAAIEPGRVRVVYNGRDVPARSHDAIVGSAHQTGRVRVLFAGRFEEQKGADLLAAIFGHLAPDLNATLDVVVAGSGRLEAQVRHGMAQLAGLRAPIVTTPIPDLGRRLGEFDVVIVPSRFEGLGLTAVEAALTGVTVVATRVPGLDEVFPDGYRWFAAPGDARAFAVVLSEALRQRALWPEIIVEAQDFARSRFGLGAMVRAYGDLYEAIDADSRGAAPSGHS